MHSKGAITCTESQIVPKWNARLEIFRRIQATENSTQYFLHRTDILQKAVVGCPCQMGWQKHIRQKKGMKGT